MSCRSPRSGCSRPWPGPRRASLGVGRHSQAHGEAGPEPVARDDRPDAGDKIRFELRGLEMVDKLVTRSGKSGRVYLPTDWCGKRVKIIRLD